MRLSLIISVLDSHEIVRRQVNYILSFLPKDCEFIIVDDGSDIPLSTCIDFKECTSHYDEEIGMWIRSYGDNFKIIETNDKRPWTQPCGRNIAAKISTGEILLMTDIDHIITPEAISFALTESYDKMVFLRKYAILDENSVLSRDTGLLSEYGCPEKHFETRGCHANTFAMKRCIFLELLNGYDEIYCGKYGGDDVDLNNRYAKLVNENKASRSIPGAMIYVFPAPRRDVKKIFHKLRMK